MNGASPDLEINCAVRRVFVRHWIDLGKLSFRTQKGRVTLRGSLDRLPGSEQLLTVQAVEQLFTELQRIHGVDRFATELTNWERNSSGWKNTRGQIASAPAASDPAPASSGNPHSYVITGGSGAKNA